MAEGISRVLLQSWMFTTTKRGTVESFAGCKQKFVIRGGDGSFGSVLNRSSNIKKFGIIVWRNRRVASQPIFWKVVEKRCPYHIVESIVLSSPIQWQSNLGGSVLLKVLERERTIWAH